MGEVPWSRTLQKARDGIWLWKTVLSHKRGAHVSTRLISRLERRVKEQYSLQFSREEVELKLKESFHCYYELKKIAHSLRESWLRDLVALKAKDSSNN